MIDSESLGGFGDRLTNQLTDGRTFVNVESLSRLKSSIKKYQNGVSCFKINVRGLNVEILITLCLDSHKSNKLISLFNLKSTFLFCASQKSSNFLRLLFLAQVSTVSKFVYKQNLYIFILQNSFVRFVICCCTGTAAKHTKKYPIFNSKVTICFQIYQLVTQTKA